MVGSACHSCPPALRATGGRAQFVALVCAPGAHDLRMVVCDRTIVCPMRVNAFIHIVPAAAVRASLKTARLDDHLCGVQPAIASHRHVVCCR